MNKTKVDIYQQWENKHGVSEVILTLICFGFSEILRLRLTSVTEDGGVSRELKSRNTKYGEDKKDTFAQSFCLVTALQ